MSVQKKNIRNDEEEKPLAILSKIQFVHKAIMKLMIREKSIDNLLNHNLFLVTKKGEEKSVYIFLCILRLSKENGSHSSSSH